MTNVELYQALKDSIGDKAARLIAEVFPRAEDLVTKSHVDQRFAEVDKRFAEVDRKIAELRGEMREGFATVRAEIHAEGKNAMRWMLGLFLPVWAATLGTLVIALLKL